MKICIFPFCSVLFCSVLFCSVLLHVMVPAVNLRKTRINQILDEACFMCNAFGFCLSLMAFFPHCCTNHVTPLIPCKQELHSSGRGLKKALWTHDSYLYAVLWWPLSRNNSPFLDIKRSVVSRNEIVSIIKKASLVQQNPTHIRISHAERFYLFFLDRSCSEQDSSHRVFHSSRPDQSSFSADTRRLNTGTTSMASTSSASRS